MYAVKDHVQRLLLSDKPTTASVATLPLATFLPNVEDCVALREEFITLVAQVLMKYLPWFKCFKPVVPEHIPHEYTKVISQKSDIVSG